MYWVLRLLFFSLCALVNSFSKTIWKCFVQVFQSWRCTVGEETNKKGKLEYLWATNWVPNISKEGPISYSQLFLESFWWIHKPIKSWIDFKRVFLFQERVGDISDPPWNLLLNTTNWFVLTFSMYRKQFECSK